MELIDRTQAVAPLEQTATYKGIAAAIRANGPMNYADFMDASMYVHRDSFYESGDAEIGYEAATRDFITQVSISPFLALSVTNWLNEQWQRQGQPSVFPIVETGPGNGIMARTILDEMADQYPRLAAATNYTNLELATGMIDQQRRMLDGYPVTWVQGSAINPPMRNVGAIISNEGPDAWPAHLITKRGEIFTELYVNLNEQGDFYELEGPLSSVEVEEYCRMSASFRTIADGETFAVSTNIANWIRNTIDALGERGAMLAIDYGSFNGPSYETARYYTSLEKLSSLPADEALRRGRILSYQHAGRVDITTDVNFALTNKLAEQNGAQINFSGSQREFMHQHGHSAAYARIMGGLAIGKSSPGKIFERSYENYVREYGPRGDIASFATIKTAFGYDKGVPRLGSPLKAVAYSKA